MDELAQTLLAQTGAASSMHYCAKPSKRHSFIAFCNATGRGRIGLCPQSFLTPCLRSFVFASISHRSASHADAEKSDGIIGREAKGGRAGTDSGSSRGGKTERETERGLPRTGKADITSCGCPADPCCCAHRHTSHPSPWRECEATIFLYSHTSNTRPSTG